MAYSIDTTSYPSPNYDARPEAVRAIVLHTGEGSKASDLITLRNDRVAPSKRVSAHYYVDRAGHIYQLVDPTKRAWHAGESSYLGKSHWNDFSIGIETEHKAGQDWPAAQRDALAWLCRQLIDIFHIPQAFVAAHRWIAPQRKQDPTDWPNPELIAWIARLYGDAPPLVMEYLGLPVFQRPELTGPIAGYLTSDSTVTIDATSGPGYTDHTAHLSSGWGFVDMRQLRKKL